jgi:hypothetical protein
LLGAATNLVHLSHLLIALSGQDEELYMTFDHNTLYDVISGLAKIESLELEFTPYADLGNWSHSALVETLPTHQLSRLRHLKVQSFDVRCDTTPGETLRR